jgi:hypothetical protein
MAAIYIVLEVFVLSSQLDQDQVIRDGDEAAEIQVW